MPGIADLLYLGQPNPQQQIAAFLSGQSPQGGPPQGAGPAGQPPSPNGPVAPNAPAPDAQPVNASPGDPPPPGSPPQPQALQSTPQMNASYQALANPPNLMSLYLQLQQRQSASDQINHGLALIAANHAGNPAMARAIMDSANAGGNAAGQVGDLMSLYNAQTQMAGQQQMLQHADEYDAKLGLPPGTSRSMILAGRGSELVSKLEPTDEMRNIQAKHDMFIKGGGTEEDWQRNYAPFLLTGGAGGGDSATRSWQQERIRWQQDNPGQPFPWGTDDPTSFALWKTKQDELTKDQQEASNKRPQYTANLTALRDHLTNIIGDPSNPDPSKLDLLKSAMSKPGAQAYLTGDPKDLTTQALGAALTPEEKALLDEVRDTTNPKLLFGTLGTRAPKRGQSDVSEIGSGLEGMTNVRKPFDNYVNGVKSTIAAIDKGIGNAYGASGEAENAPDYAKPYIDDSYLPGGSMYPYGKKATPMNQTQIDAATKAIKGAPDQEGERQKLIHLYLANNVDPAPLRNMRF